MVGTSRVHRQEIHHGMLAHMQQDDNELWLFREEKENLVNILEEIVSQMMIKSTTLQWLYSLLHDTTSYTVQ